MSRMLGLARDQSRSQIQGQRKATRSGLQIAVLETIHVVIERRRVGFHERKRKSRHVQLSSRARKERPQVGPSIESRIVLREDSEIVIVLGRDLRFEVVDEAEGYARSERLHTRGRFLLVNVFGDFEPIENDENSSTIAELVLAGFVERQISLGTSVITTSSRSVESDRLDRLKIRTTNKFAEQFLSHVCPLSRGAVLGRRGSWRHCKLKLRRLGSLIRDDKLEM